MEDAQDCIYRIDLNVDASIGEQQPSAGDLFLLTAYVQQQEHPHLHKFFYQHKFFIYICTMLRIFGDK
jgi:hypothetical protein